MRKMDLLRQRGCAGVSVRRPRVSVRRPRTPVRLAMLLCALVWAGPALAMEALSINPAWVPKNTAPAGSSCTVRGVGFAPTTTVAFDGVAATVTYVDSRTLTVVA